MKKMLETNSINILHMYMYFIARICFFIIIINVILYFSYICLIHSNNIINIE